MSASHSVTPLGASTSAPEATCLALGTSSPTSTRIVEGARSPRIWTDCAGHATERIVRETQWRAVSTRRGEMSVPEQSPSPPMSSATIAGSRPRSGTPLTISTWSAATGGGPASVAAGSSPVARRASTRTSGSDAHAPRPTAAMKASGIESLRNDMSTSWRGPLFTRCAERSGMK